MNSRATGVFSDTIITYLWDKSPHFPANKRCTPSAGPMTGARHWTERWFTISWCRVAPWIFICATLLSICFTTPPHLQAAPSNSLNKLSVCILPLFPVLRTVSIYGPFKENSTRRSTVCVCPLLQMKRHIAVLSSQIVKYAHAMNTSHYSLIIEKQWFWNCCRNVSYFYPFSCNLFWIFASVMYTTWQTFFKMRFMYLDDCFILLIYVGVFTHKVPPPYSKGGIIWGLL